MHRERKNAPRLFGCHYKFTQPFFVTMKIKHSLPILGKIREGVWHPDPAGEMVEMWFYRIEDHFSEVRCGVFQGMPDHVHFILTGREPAKYSTQLKETLPEVIAWYKARTTNAYIQGVREFGWPPYPGRLWQRSFHDSRILTEAGVSRVRRYIQNNPRNWRG